MRDKDRKEIKEIVRIELLGYILGIIFIILLSCGIYSVLILGDHVVEVHKCYTNAKTLIGEPYYDLTCYANDNFYKLIDNEIKCECFYQGEYELMGFGTKQKYFNLR